MHSLRLLILLACIGSGPAAERLIFFAEYAERYSARVTKAPLTDGGTAEFLVIADGDHVQRIPFEVGQQFFLTAEFSDLDGDGRPELIVYCEYGTGLESLLFKEGPAGAWVNAFAHCAKSRVAFFGRTSEQAAACWQEDGTVRRWCFQDAPQGSWVIVPATEGGRR